jgi:16S rRNA (guanine527-N7)-methyltransferase
VKAKRLTELGARWDLTSDQLDRLAAVLELVKSDPTAPTSVRGEAAVHVHVADSLSGLTLDCVRAARRIADLGAGPGFPGAVLAIALEDAHVALVESAARKCEFLERLCAHGRIENAVVVHARAEEWPEGALAHDLVVSRAVAPLAVLCEYAAPLLELGGSLVAWKGAVGAVEAQAGAKAAALLGLEPEIPVRTEPYAASVAHHLHAFRKVGATPAGFPRRAGVARKRPLGELR